MDQPRIPSSSSSMPVPVPSILISPSSPDTHPFPSSSKPSLTSSPRLPGSLPSPPSSLPPSRTPSSHSQSPQPRSTSQSFFASLANNLPSMPNMSMGGMGSISASLGGILNPNKGVLMGATFGGGGGGKGKEKEVNITETERGGDGRVEQGQEREESESESESESGYDESEEGPRTRTNTSQPRREENESERVGRQSMDLRIEQATTGPSSVSDSSPSSPIISTPFSGTKPLHRTPSSAFRLASSSGPIHPLTLQAIKRQDSEAAAIRFQAEMGAEFERRDSTVEDQGEGGEEGFGLGRVRSESPTNIDGFEQEEEEDLGGGERMERNREDSQATLREVSSRGVKNLGNGKLEEGGLVGDDQGRNVSTSSTKSVSGKKGFFSRFKKSKPTSPTSPASPTSPISATSTSTMMSGSGSGSGGMKRSGSVVSRAPTTRTIDSRGPITPGLSESGEPPLGGSGSTKHHEPKVRHPKVRTKGKGSRKDFSLLFLAQELHLPSLISSRPTTNETEDPSEVHSLHTVDSRHSLPPHHSPQELVDGSLDETPPTPSASSPDKKGGKCKSSSGTGGGGEEKSSKSKKKSRAIWAVKFSNNGKWLAVGGRDGVVRIWEVLSTREERELAGTTTGTGFMPVFKEKPTREWKGHSSDVLDLNWSKNDFLLSSSMDKTVRLWHIDRDECLCSFEHLDFVTSIAFHPKDDRFFLSGSLDCKLRLWNIVEKRVQVWTELPELITAVSFTRDGKFAIAGSFVGQCMFFEVETFKYHNVFTAKSSKRKDQKGKKITSLCTFPLDFTNPDRDGEDGDRLLVTSNDSHMRLYNTKGRFVEAKYSGHENTSSQIRASFSDDGKYVISGSEDRHVYIWDSGIARNSYGEFDVIKKRSEGTGFESFSMPAHIVTAALFAPSTTRAHLASAGDPIFSNEEHYPHLSPFPYTNTRSSAGGGSEADSSKGRKGGKSSSTAEDMIIVVADAETGTISIFRNSRIPPLRPLSSSAPHSAAGSIFRHNNHVSTTSIGTDNKQKRWSRASASSH